MIARLRIPYFETSALELFLALTSIVWGVWLLLPFESFSMAYATSPADIVRTIYGGENSVGVVFLMIGVMKYFAVRHGRFTRTVAVLGAMCWGFIAAVFAIANPTSRGFPIYAMLCVGNLFVAARTVAR